MPPKRKTIRIEPMNPIPEQIVANEQAKENNHDEFPEDNKQDINPPSNQPVTEPEKQDINPPSNEPVTETEKQDINPPSNEPNHVQAENKAKPDKITCHICGKSMTKKSFKYTHLNNCHGLKKKEKTIVSKQREETNMVPKEKEKGERPIQSSSDQQPNAKTDISTSNNIDSVSTSLLSKDARLNRIMLRKERMSQLFSSSAT
jgi:ssDNA-binding Zn-finger/Zn-ribbon topoisomerase 1